MKKTLIFVVMLIFVISGAHVVFAAEHQTDTDQPHKKCPMMKQMHQEQEGDTQQMHPSKREMEWYCPWCGALSSGEMGTEMKHEGKGMHHGEGMHHGWSRAKCPAGMSEKMKPMSQDDVRMLMKHYISANPNLKVGEITEEEDVYVGEIVTKDDSLVEKLVVNKKTGWMKRTY